VLLAVANDENVTVHLNPFDTGDPVLRFDVPLYQIAFALFAIGVIVGGLIVWIRQGRYRRRARDLGYDAELWQRRAERSAHTNEAEAPQPTAFLPRPERS
jgi:hypothetical protein